jgi:eukaryotic translation initiation factor 2C
MLQIPATILPYPKPEYRNGSVAMTKPSWDLTRHKFLLTNNRVVFKCFMIIVPDGIGEMADPAFLQHTWDAFVAGSKTYSTGTFSRVGHHMSPDLARNRAEATIAMDKAQAKGANYIMLFLGKKSIPAYSAIKDLADRKYGMHSSCLVYKDRGFTLQYWGNLMMKVNLKTGGLNHTAAGVNDVLKDTLVLGA